MKQLTFFLADLGDMCFRFCKCSTLARRRPEKLVKVVSWVDRRSVVPTLWKFIFSYN